MADCLGERRACVTFHRSSSSAGGYHLDSRRSGRDDGFDRRVTIGMTQRRLQLAALQNDLVDTVAHELRTPLASMRLLADTLRSGQIHDPAQVNEYLDLMSQENMRLTRLVENFLSFSRAKRGDLSLEIRPVDVSEVIATAVSAAGPRLDADDCQVQRELPADLPRVQADRDGLVAVLLNLIDNAYKYSSPPRMIRIAATQQGRYLALTVEDNGAGMSRAALRRIFRRFYRVDRHLNQPVGGCGLGLSIVKTTVEAMGGNVQVTSNVGVGSKFTLLLPVAEGDAA